MVELKKKIILFLAILILGKGTAKDSQKDKEESALSKSTKRGIVLATVGAVIMYVAINVEKYKRRNDIETKEKNKKNTKKKRKKVFLEVHTEHIVIEPDNKDKGKMIMPTKTSDDNITIMSVEEKKDYDEEEEKDNTIDNYYDSIEGSKAIRKQQLLLFTINELSKESEKVKKGANNVVAYICDNLVPDSKEKGERKKIKSYMSGVLGNKGRVKKSLNKAIDRIIEKGFNVFNIQRTRHPNIDKIIPSFNTDIV